MGKVKSLGELASMATEIAPRMFGEIFEDGQFRGHMSKADTPLHVIVIGDYQLWTLGEGEVGIGFVPTGEMGIFKTADFEPYLKAFFGLNF
jgi:hypothetical protein